MKKPLLAAAVLVAAPVFTQLATPAFAQVDVVESEPVRSAPFDPDVPPMPSTSVAPPVQSGGSDLFYQLQLLREEILQLRGMVEEQAFELKRLKQQRMDDYLDLDRRVSALSGTSPTNKSSDDTTSSSMPPVTTSASSGDERKVYRSAIDLVLKKKDYDQAVNELNRYLQTYPGGRYAANSHYWLGEIFLLKNELEQARQWFTKLLDSYASHRKAPDAKFKLGKVYDLLGNKDKAKSLLEDVAGSNTDAARLARNYLQENF